MNMLIENLEFNFVDEGELLSLAESQIHTKKKKKTKQNHRWYFITIFSVAGPNQ